MNCSNASSPLASMYVTKIVGVELTPSAEPLARSSCHVVACRLDSMHDAKLDVSILTDSASVLIVSRLMLSSESYIASTRFQKWFLPCSPAHSTASAAIVEFSLITGKWK